MMNCICHCSDKPYILYPNVSTHHYVQKCLIKPFCCTKRGISPTTTNLGQVPLDRGQMIMPRDMYAMGYIRYGDVTQGENAMRQSG
jgi:hypothetical protein